MGDPAGIGPEVIIKALADPAVRGVARFVIFGMNDLLTYAADRAEIEPFWFRLQHDAQRAKRELVHDVVVLDYDEFSMLTLHSHKPTKQGGHASLQFLDDAVAATRRPRNEGGIDALVTAPICKASWALAGCNFPGHTEFLQHRTKARRVGMMFHAADEKLRLNVVLATIHVPLMDIRNLLTIGKVHDAIDLGHAACLQLGIPHPRVAVCGLNPHAGEGGLFGDEETRLIQPAIDVARDAGMTITDPLPADTVFGPASRGGYDLVVAMYHDQGLIPVKMLAFDLAVNITLGLPLIRTSPDHGTAFDIVGTNRADPGSMKRAIQLAARLAAAS